ncbi:hypothetical protein [Bremerella sp. P1]|uniref:hypothetical protein n=1 Tax=Bremerella sp. P1 TaxID=3026424 RepID=UPI002368E3EE|nr:hypothetical protein [Bremerella sp. P1]WDI43718.1 hypothetical protein PSR63_07130 [Bremerella sp. P1]
MPSPKFDLGQIVATPGALEALESAGQNPTEFLTRHVAGDWGELDQEDQQANDDALQSGARLLSAYRLTDDTKLWIITEADRSSTCILLPSEY